MVGCKVVLGTQPEECVYLPEKASDPAKALAFLGLRKAAHGQPGSPEPAQLRAAGVRCLPALTAAMHRKRHTREEPPTRDERSSKEPAKEGQQLTKAVDDSVRIVRVGAKLADQLCVVRVRPSF